MTGRVSYVASEKAQDENFFAFDEELSRQVFPFVQWVTLSVVIASPFLVIMSIYKPCLCYGFFYLNMVIVVLAHLLPNQWGHRQAMLIDFTIIFDTVFFTMFTLQFWPSLVILLLNQVYVEVVVRQLVYLESGDFEMLFNLFLSVLWKLATLLAIKVTVSWVGKLYVSSRANAQSNELFLDELEEGVAIIG